MDRLLAMTLALLLCQGYGVRASEAAETDVSTAKAEPKRDAAARRARTSRYLETGGQRKLDVLYKKMPEGDLHLDLYYPTGSQSGKRPVVVYTHGGGWGGEFEGSLGSPITAACQPQVLSIFLGTVGGPSGTMPFAW